MPRTKQSLAYPRAARPRRGAALMTALFIMAVTSVLVISILDTETLQYAALRNTLHWDRARYLAEAGVQHAFANLEVDFAWRGTVPATEFPAGSGNTYSATAADGPDGTVLVTGVGVSGAVTRRLTSTVKQGG